MKLTYFLAMLLLVSACAERGSNNKNGDGESAYDDVQGDGAGEKNSSADIIDNSDIDDNAFSTTPYFAKWDNNGDNEIDETEFDNNYFSMLDKNGDKSLEKGEWEKGIKSFFGGNGELNYGDMSDWDTDSNGQVSKEEFTAYLKDKNIYGDWASGDNPMTEKEFAKGVFQHWDTDDNGVVESEEFTEEYNRVGEGV